MKYFKLLVEEQENCGTQGNDAGDNITVKLNESSEGDQEEEDDQEPGSDFGGEFHFFLL
jgi:hypothetical protein